MCVEIYLASPSVDTWLALYDGSGTGTNLLLADDDSGDGTNAFLGYGDVAGTRTIEATTFLGGVTGPFELTVRVGTDTVTCDGVP